MNMQRPDKAVITIATGKPIYINMAVNLARSFKWWNTDNSIQFYLATDRQDLIPSDLQDINIIELSSEQSNQGFCSKLYLDTLAPAHKNLFIDADCLCYGNIDFVFEKFAGHSVSAIGKSLKEGEFFGDIQQMCLQFEVPEIPVFVGSIYYLEIGKECDRIFATARDLKSKYDQYGLVRLRDKPNEEPLIAISMAIHGQKPIEDDGRIKVDLMNFEPTFEADILQGHTNFTVNQEVRQSFNFLTATPVIIHYNDNFINCPQYVSASIILEKIMLNKWHQVRASIYGHLLYLIIGQYKQVIATLKDILRPLYRKFFGYRKIPKNLRME